MVERENSSFYERHNLDDTQDEALRTRLNTTTWLPLQKDPILFFRSSTLVMMRERMGIPISGCL